MAGAQPSPPPSILANPALSGKYVQAVDQKVARFNCQAENYTRHALDNLIGVEKKMQQRMAGSDPVRSRQLFGYSIDSLQKLKAAISAGSSRVTRFVGGGYFAYADTLKQSLAFLQHVPGTTGQATTLGGQLSSSLRQVDELEGKFSTIASIQTFIQQRQQVLNDALGKLPQYEGSLEQVNKMAYYYSAQIAQYKSTLKDPAAVERKMLDLVEQSPAFQKLMENNGRLAGLFAPRSVLTGIPLTGGGSAVSGLPSRAMLQQYIKKNMPLLADTSDPLSQLQSKFTSAGSKLHESGSMPGLSSGAAFAPNSQRTKPLGRRIEWGLDLQFGRAVSYLPTTANIGVKAGYRLNDRLSVGIGVDYLVGMGMGWKDIHFTNQGVGLRSYGKWQIKKGWNIQGGAEFNYMTSFQSIAQLRALPNWQTSALVGISKQYKVSRKISGNFQLLYDFLYRQHLPNTQPVIFRLGYDLK